MFRLLQNIAQTKAAEQNEMITVKFGSHKVKSVLYKERTFKNLLNCETYLVLGVRLGSSNPDAISDHNIEFSGNLFTTRPLNFIPIFRPRRCKIHTRVQTCRRK